jgi:hypothetical protein
VVAPTAAIPAADLRCAKNVPAVRVAPSYAKSFTANGSGGPKVEAAQTAALTVADLTDRWLESVSGVGFGLRGGSWTSSGDRVVTLHLKGVRLARDLAVSGTVTWARYTHRVAVQLRVTQVGAGGATVHTDRVNGTLNGTWDTRAAGARVHLTGTQGGQAVSYGFPAP